MDIVEKNNFLFDNVTSLRGVGKQLSKYLKSKKIEKNNDLLWNLPYSFTDRSESVPLNKLEVGKILTIQIKVIKYNFPRIRNLPNKINCEDSTGKIDLVFFNSREGYIKKILPLNEWVVVSGKIAFYKNKYQITNPEYITNLNNIDYVKKVIPKYSLTEGLTEKSYRKLIEQILIKLPPVKEWHENSFLKKMNFPSWKDSILSVHNGDNVKDFNSNAYRRLAFDELLSHLIVLSENRKRIKKLKKKSKKFKNLNSKNIIKALDFKLTNSQLKVIQEINIDLKSTNKMFRVLQGDVGSGKTIVSLIAAANVIESGYQCVLMAPTSILANQHYNLVKKIFDINNLKINISLLTGKTDYKSKNKILENLRNHKIDFVIGTHALFQKKILFKKLGLTIIDEQHKFGVKQRIDLSKKGGDECDVLLMSATPIPRTLMLSLYGDMDISKITEKPLNRKKIITLSKPEEKINELWPLISQHIKNKNQIFWVCPLIEESKIFNYTSAVKKYELMKKKFPNKVGLVHGQMSKDEKDLALKNFLEKKIDILVSTTVIEVGIDFPNATIIIIENSNKFGLAQLHQLRGRVGRGKKQGMCILLYKKTLSKNSIKRIKILKLTNDGFLIAEEDLKLRGFGDLIGFQQSGIKNFKIADPIQHEDLFKIAEKKINEINDNLENYKEYNFLLKLFDKADIINEINIS